MFCFSILYDDDTNSNVFNQIRTKWRLNFILSRSNVTSAAFSHQFTLFPSLGTLNGRKKQFSPIVWGVFLLKYDENCGETCFVFVWADAATGLPLNVLFVQSCQCVTFWCRVAGIGIPERRNFWIQIPFFYSFKTIFIQ